VGRRWRGQGGRERAEKKKVWEGPWARFSSFPPLLLAWVGAGGAGLDSGVSQEHGYSAWASKHSEPHSKLGFGLIFSASVRRNARKNLNFEFLKFSNLGDQHKSQGIQIYFCYQEWFSFAEILFQI
jgi:hypothetical protein